MYDFFLRKHNYLKKLHIYASYNKDIITNINLGLDHSDINPYHYSSFVFIFILIALIVDLKYKQRSLFYIIPKSPLPNMLCFHLNHYYPTVCWLQYLSVTALL